MELALYNAVLTAMSVDGRQYTYVNQLASSDKHPATRSEWFKCACCPPNILRTLAIIGGYIYSQPTTEDDSTHIAVHLYVPSTMNFKVGGSDSQITMNTNWPWDGKVDFALKTTSKNVAISLRIPTWTSKWTVRSFLQPHINYLALLTCSQISPETPSLKVQKGYLTLPAEWVASNPNFTITIAQDIRMIATHPFTNQDSLTLARGPIIFCVEDHDNPWVTDHFKSLQLDPDAAVQEALVTDPATKEEYVALSVHRGASILSTDRLRANPGVGWAELKKMAAEAEVLDELHFVPYYFRSNRGGRGQSRTGIRRWIR